MRSAVFLIIGLVLSAALFPPQWYSPRLRFEMAQIFGIPAYEERASMNATDPEMMAPTEEACPEDLLGWRDAQVIDGVSIAAAPTCVADNPYAIAAFVRGTNNVSTDTLLRAGLAPDAVVKGADLDGDGDPDEIHIRLEVAELNGGSPDMLEPTAQFALAPGITPGLWVFVPKSFGMATENFESNVAMDLLRLPSPSIRIEQGDVVKVTLENTHYMPHTIHFHGVDHSYLTADGQGNDGTMTSEMPLLPGEARTYELNPRSTGTAFYHCHVQSQAHILMGLQGMFIVEENRPNNMLQTLNVGAGQVRVTSQASREEYDQEYDLHYTDLDSGLSSIIQRSNDPAEIERWIHGGYNLIESNSDYYTLNGRSFPYTFRESLVVTGPDELIRLRVLNAGSAGLALHPHGHKVTATHLDGVLQSLEAQVTRDVFWLASAQRADFTLNTTNDGLHSYGSGVWMLHDHGGRGITNNGIAPGGNMNAIVYREYLDDNGWPISQGEDMSMFFNPAFYRRDDAMVMSGETQFTAGFMLRVIAFSLALGLALASLVRLLIPVVEERR
ncbi:MAG: multicopper oxidase domain-containing protein [Gammaproteobacteria bacterium]|nr:multicopper oxidase domain-containing protein [Gammaproteobacteria bacterium]MDP2141472.1 multicopper oxidase domain-containing protein [Gammaproteobacteria bacterium]MDP2347503.1 multicopper oxidase domain-containing protein [Gammaproteobacteria bacterium]